jgi:two-component system NtrC family response regulator
MLYLLYLISGFIKKFPLQKTQLTIGRSSRNDLVINEPFVSNKHARITVLGNHIEIEDLNSTNGLFVEDSKISKAVIHLNQFFRIGYINFYLKQGNAQEFIVSSKIEPVLTRISHLMNRKNAEKTQSAINLLYTEPLLEMLQIGFKMDKSIDLFKYAATPLNKYLKEGSLLLVSREESDSIIESRWNYESNDYPLILEILQNRDVFSKPILNQLVENAMFSSYPIAKKSSHLALIYLLKGKKPIQVSTNQFIMDLAAEISIIDSLIEQNKIIISPTEPSHPEIEIITKNSGMLTILSQCKKIANSNLFVMIEGETGTGKELIAKFIHFHSKRKDGPFVALNCAAIPENLMEMELFGHEKGAFTDANIRRQGKLELASTGTLLLDEIGDMPLSLQQKLLRAIQEKQFYPIGSNQPVNIDLRIICLTHKNIKELLAQKLFREDLYYRLAHVSLTIPPLKDRKDDIIPLINYFVKKFSTEMGISIQGFSQESIENLENYSWPGNIRELENEIKKLVSLADNNDTIDSSALKNEIIQNRKTFVFSANQLKSEPTKEKEQLIALMNQYKWNKSLAAKALNISRPSLYEKLKKHGIQ